jgi:hypothetical protein
MARAVVLVVCALVVCVSRPAAAQTFESIGIRAQGMAGAFVAVADDATASWWNPAGLATSRSFVDGIVEAGRREHWGVSFGFPALGVSYYHLNISQIRASASTAAGATGRQDLGVAGTGLPVVDQVGFNQFGASVGQSIGNHFVVASTIKVIHAQSATRGDFDVGLMASYGPVRTGLNVKNLVSGTFGTGDGAFELTRQVRAGIAMLTQAHGAFDRLTVSMDVDLTTTSVDGRDERHLAGGVEGWMLGERVAVRGGVGANLITDHRTGDAQGPYGAAGFTVSPAHRFFVDGAATVGPTAARNGWGIDLRLTF